MINSSITLLTFASVTLLVISLSMLIYEWLFRYRFMVRERLKEISGASDDESSIGLFKDLKRLGTPDLFKQTLRERTDLWLEQAGFEWSAKVVVAWCLGAGAGVCVVGFVTGIWWIVALAPMFAAAPLLLIQLRRARRQRSLCRQLPDAFQMVSRAVRSGQTVPAALKIIAEDFEPPISHEFALCYEQQNLGVSRESALRKLAQRTGIMELRIFVVALLVQAKSGGDLAELLDNLAGMVRKRLKLTDRVRALTGEGRMQAIVLTLLPIAGFLALLAFSPQYAQSLLERPWLLAATAAAQAVGTFWIRRIVNFEF